MARPIDVHHARALRELDKKRIAIVTGGTRGIGAAIARHLLATGLTVAATYHGNDNVIAKQLILLADADAAGIVLGLRVPLILTSRAAGARARMASCALALLLQKAGFCHH